MISIRMGVGREPYLCPLHGFDCQQEKFAFHIGMDRTLEFIASRARHLEADGRVAVRVQKDPPYALTIDNHTVPFDLDRDPLKHDGSEIMTLRILIPNMDDGR